jgi:hypothetical protein
MSVDETEKEVDIGVGFELTEAVVTFTFLYKLIGDTGAYLATDI